MLTMVLLIVGLYVYIYVYIDTKHTSTSLLESYPVWQSVFKHPITLAKPHPLLLTAESEYPINILCSPVNRGITYLLP